MKCKFHWSLKNKKFINLWSVVDSSNQSIVAIMVHQSQKFLSVYLNTNKQWIPSLVQIGSQPYLATVSTWLWAATRNILHTTKWNDYVYIELNNIFCCFWPMLMSLAQREIKRVRLIFNLVKTQKRIPTSLVMSCANTYVICPRAKQNCKRTEYQLIADIATALWYNHW